MVQVCVQLLIRDQAGAKAQKRLVRLAFFAPLQRLDVPLAIFRGLQT